MASELSAGEVAVLKSSAGCADVLVLAQQHRGTLEMGKLQTFIMHAAACFISSMRSSHSDTLAASLHHMRILQQCPTHVRMQVKALSLTKH